MSSLTSYESFVEDCSRIYCQRLKEFASDGKVINMGHCMQCYAVDVIGEITVSLQKLLCGYPSHNVLPFLAAPNPRGGIYTVLSFGACD